MPILFHRYAKYHETKIYEKVVNNRGRTLCNYILRGTWVGVTEEKGEWYRVVTAGNDGWLKKTSVSSAMGLKMFFVDVGQGDGVLLEIGDERIIIDGGPSDNFKNYLEGWQYKYLIEENEKVHIDKMFVSHFDSDHYKGLIDIINNPAFTIDTIYHNGIARFYTDNDLKKGKIRPAEYNEDLGTVVDDSYLITTFDSFDDLEQLYNNGKGGFQYTFNLFYAAVSNAINQGRLKHLKRLTNKETIWAKTIEEKRFKINVLGPVLTNYHGKEVYKWFDDSSHTRNGHSIVLKVEYGTCSVLLGGDLNSYAEQHLIDFYGDNHPFEVDVAKSCHHGSSDFLTDFMEKVNPYATVISSGDNETYAHPRADAIGCAGKYARGDRPLVFSTELARSVNKGGDILYGMINLRCDGEDIVMAQMKEGNVSKNRSIWNKYSIK